MNWRFTVLAVGMLHAASGVLLSAEQPQEQPPGNSTEPAPVDRFLPGPPTSGGPVSVWADFELYDINEINDEGETFEFTGVLTLKWRDRRQAFDPTVVGVKHKIYQGDYQFNEVFSGWFPQVVLANESGMYEKNGVVLRIEPDGMLTLAETINASAETEFDMWRYPFDEQRLEAVFRILGYGSSEVAIEVASTVPILLDNSIRIPQWNATEIRLSNRECPARNADGGAAAALAVTVNVRRASFFIRRLIVIPLVLIVLLSFSVFWMDQSSLGDRISVSFIGILTGVAYQLVISDILPRISYFTLMNAFLNISFLAMCASVVINLVVATLDKKGLHDAGNRLDRRCRWIFPLTYFGLIWVTLGVVFLLP